METACDIADDIVYIGRNWSRTSGPSNFKYAQSRGERKGREKEHQRLRGEEDWRVGNTRATKSIHAHMNFARLLAAP